MLFSNTKCEFKDKGEAVATFGSFTDIAELKEQQKRIHDLAYYDSLTGLPNRVMLGKVINESIGEANKHNSRFSMIFIDLDNFKFVNDSYGHLVGDRLLIEVGNRVREVSNSKTISFRLGGDEFIVLIKDIDNKDEVERFRKYLHKALISPILLTVIYFMLLIAVVQFYILKTEIVFTNS